MFVLFFLFDWAVYAGDFEELFVSASVEARGKTGIFPSQDASSIYYNPSLSFFKGFSLSFLHAENFGGLVKNNFVAFSKGSGETGFGFGVYRVGVDSILLTDSSYDPSLSPSDSNYPRVIKTISTNEWVFYSNISRNFKKISAGINLKLIYRDLYFETAVGAGVDAGVYIPLDNFFMGLRVKNLSSSPIFWSNDSLEIMAPRIGAGVGTIKKISDFQIILVAEARYEIDTREIFYRAGGEVLFLNAFTIRSGFNESGWTLGAGVKYKRFFFDYAFIPWLDGSHLVSTGIRF